VDELRKQLDKLDGSGVSGGSSAPAGPGTDAARAGLSSAFPSIRQLPLLGVRWTDLYRQTKIEETVYELLTQQYELAKIEEAKEIPTVKILDAADVPERKSFPPRSEVVVLGTMLALLLAITRVYAAVLWQNLSADSLGRVIASALGRKIQELAAGCGAKWPMRRIPGMQPVDSLEVASTLNNATGET
jgi:hypothetical protein